MFKKKCYFQFSQYQLHLSNYTLIYTTIKIIFLLCIYDSKKIINIVYRDSLSKKKKKDLNQLMPCTCFFIIITFSSPKKYCCPDRLIHLHLVRKKGNHVQISIDHAQLVTIKLVPLDSSTLFFTSSRQRLPPPAVENRHRKRKVCFNFYE